MIDVPTYDTYTLTVSVFKKLICFIFGTTIGTSDVTTNISFSW